MTRQVTRHRVECDDCQGTGQRSNGFRPGSHDCDNCSGEGEWLVCDYCGEPDECDCAQELAA